MKRIKGLNEQADYIKYLEDIRYKEVEYCPHCGHFNVSRKRENGKIGRWNCYNCGSSFNVLSGTLFQGTSYPLEIWFDAIRLMLLSQSSLSSNGLARHLGLDQRAAYSIQMRIREEFLNGLYFSPMSLKLSGILEADETYLDIKIGKETKQGRGANKLKILGVVERGGRVATRVVSNVKGSTINRFIEDSVNPEGSKLITDNFKSYSQVADIVEHRIMTRKDKGFTNGIHTNTMEGFWRLMKKSLKGTHHHYSEDNAQYYIAEYCYKYNHRFFSDELIFYGFLCHSLRAYELIPNWDKIREQQEKD